MNLSPHFTLAELTKSQTALRLGLDNSPTPEHIENLKYLALNILEPIRNKFGAFTPNSGYRSKALNEAINGSAKSQHSKGEAVDLDIVGVPNKKLCKWIYDNLEFDQLILEYWNEEDNDPNSGWVHVSTTRQQCRKSCMAYDGKAYVYLKP
jgi:zinc D-Ala-D-Ala carboxypeptidase